MFFLTILDQYCSAVLRFKDTPTPSFWHNAVQTTDSAAKTMFCRWRETATQHYMACLEGVFSFTVDEKQKCIVNTGNRLFYKKHGTNPQSGSFGSFCRIRRLPVVNRIQITRKILKCIPVWLAEFALISLLHNLQGVAYWMDLMWCKNL